MRNCLHRLATVGSTARIASSLAALALATTPARAAVIPVPNGSFEILYQPGSTTITADTGGGWTHGVGPNADMEGAVATYSDTTTGNKVDIPGWVNAMGWLPSYTWPSGCGSVSKNSAQDGFYKYSANGTSWGNSNGGAIESDAPLTTVASGETYTLSVYATNDLTGKVLDLLADGVALTPDASNNSPSGVWTKTTKVYSAESLAIHTGKSLKIRVGWAAGASGTQARLDLVELSSEADSNPPILNSIEDDQGGGPVSEFIPVTYTLTFNEAMKASSIDTTDFENASATPVTVNSVAPTANPAVYLVTVTPTAPGSLQLLVKATAVIEDNAGNDLVTSPALQDDTILTVQGDSTPPTLASIVDNKGGGPVVANKTVTYTVTFSEAMNASTVETSDFENASPTATTVDSVTPTANPAVFLVAATPAAAGSIQLQIKSGANLTDLIGNALVGLPLADDTTITVNATAVNTFSVNFFVGPNWPYGGLDPNNQTQIDNVKVAPEMQAGVGDWFTDGWANVLVPWGGGLQPALTLTSNTGSNATFIFKNCRNGYTYSGGPRGTLLGDGNGNMMDAHVNSTLDANAKFDMEVTGIPFAVYDVIFYLGANAAQYGDGTGVIKFNGGTDRAFKLKQGAFDGTFTEMVDATTEGNYIVFTGVSGSSFTTQTWGTGPGGYNHIGPFGFQIREAPSGYGTWADANAPEQTPDQDHDNDGVDNGIEYFMGETGSSFTAMPGLDGTNTITWPMSPAYVGSYEVQTSPDLVNWTNVDPKPLPAGGNLSHTLPAGQGKLFLRLLVTPTQ